MRNARRNYTLVFTQWESCYLSTLEVGLLGVEV